MSIWFCISLHISHDDLCDLNYWFKTFIHKRIFSGKLNLYPRYHKWEKQNENRLNQRNQLEKFCIHSENAICIWRTLFVLRRCCSSRKRCTNCENAVHQICFHHNHRWISNKQNFVPIFCVVAVLVHSSGSTVVTRFLLIFFYFLPSSERICSPMQHIRFTEVT